MEVLEDAQFGKITFEERDHLLKPYEEFLDRIFEDCKEMDFECNNN